MKSDVLAAQSFFYFFSGSGVGIGIGIERQNTTLKAGVIWWCEHGMEYSRVKTDPDSDTDANPELRKANKIDLSNDFPTDQHGVVHKNYGKSSSCLSCTSMLIYFGKLKPIDVNSFSFAFKCHFIHAIYS